MSQIQQPPYSDVPWKGRNFLTKKDIKSRLILFCSPWKVLLNDHQVFNIWIFPNEAIANQTEKVGMFQIQQPPYNSVPWKGRNFLAKKDKKSRMVSFCSPWKSLSNGHLVFNFKILSHEAIANQSERVGFSPIQ